MNIKDLLDEQALLNETIYQLKEQIIDESIKETDFESKLWLETDFKKLKLTNKEMREAYVKQKMGTYISKVGHLKNDLKYAENELALCKTKIHIAVECGIDLNEDKE